MRTEQGRGSAPRCPFCGAELKRPADMSISAMERAQGGTCECGAVYLVDPTGKNVGTVMVQALGIAAEMLGKDLNELTPGQDYEDVVLSYDWRTHRSSGISRHAAGSGSLYIIQVKKRGGS